MTRPWFAWALCAALAACTQSTSLPKFVALDPIFDSVFVRTQKPLPSVIYFDGDKLQTPPASAVTWQSSNPTILDVNNPPGQIDRKSTRLNSSHVRISYAVFCLKKKNQKQHES